MGDLQLKVSRPRCPYCHGDIVGGEDNYACHECLTWHHTGCWTEYGSCVSCGNKQRKATDPDIGMEELMALAGHSSRPRGHDVMADLAAIGLVSPPRKPSFGQQTDTSTKTVTYFDPESGNIESVFKKEHSVYKKVQPDLCGVTEKSKRESACPHLFEAMDNKCRYCGKDAYDYYCEGGTTAKWTTPAFKKADPVVAAQNRKFRQLEQESRIQRQKAAEISQFLWIGLCIAVGLMSVLAKILL